MPVLSTDIRLRLSGGAANNDPLASLGGAKSSNDMPAGIFDDVASGESTAGRIEYRCVYAHNNAAQQLSNPVVWIVANTASANTTIDIGVGSAAVNAQEQGPLGAETTAPSGVSFSAPTTKGAGLPLGNLPAGQHKAIWIRRTVDPGAAASNDTFQLRVEGDTAA